MPEKPQNTETLRTQAELLLSQARAQSTEIQRALGAIAGGAALQSRLAAGDTTVGFYPGLPVRRPCHWPMQRQCDVKSDRFTIIASTAALE